MGWNILVGHWWLSGPANYALSHHAGWMSDFWKSQWPSYFLVEKQSFKLDLYGIFLLALNFILNSGYNSIGQIFLLQGNWRQLECSGEELFKKQNSSMCFGIFLLLYLKWLVFFDFLENFLFFSLCVGLGQLEVSLSYTWHLAVSGDIFGWGGFYWHLVGGGQECC